MEPRDDPERQGGLLCPNRERQLVELATGVRTIAGRYSEVAALLDDGTIRRFDLYESQPRGSTISGEDAVELAYGRSRVCMRRRDASVWCARHDDQLERIELPPTVELANGYGHACARTDRGDVYCWG